jgi:CcmD family protein
MNDLGFLFAGFAAAWVIAFAYLWVLAKRTRDLQHKLDKVEGRIDREF